MRVTGKGDTEELKRGMGKFWGNRYIYFLGCIDCFVGIYICQNCTLQICVIYCASVIHKVKLFLKFKKMGMENDVELLPKS